MTNEEKVAKQFRAVLGRGWRVQFWQWMQTRIYGLGLATIDRALAEPVTDLHFEILEWAEVYKNEVLAARHAEAA